jgi:aminocarboxymuconate-semialdehyde decarboxylase
MRFLVDLVGTDRIVLGSDYCFDMGYERPVQALNEVATLDVRERAKILGGNAARLLGL